MKIISTKTEILNSSLSFNEDNSIVTFQVNCYLAVEGNPYIYKPGTTELDLVTPKTVFGLTCNVSDIANIQAIAESQVNDYIAANYGG
jgi:hypothetical protein